MSDGFAPRNRWPGNPSAGQNPKPYFGSVSDFGLCDKTRTVRERRKPDLGEARPATNSFVRQASRCSDEQQAQKPFDPSTFMAAFDGGVTVSTYGEGQPSFPGAPADAVFYIQNGKVKLSVVSDQGKEAVVAFLEAGDFCGEGCLAGQLVRMATAMAATDCTSVGGQAKHDQGTS